LFDQGVGDVPKAGIEKKTGYIAQQTGRSVQQVLAFPRTKKATGDVQLRELGGQFSLQARDGERNLGHPQGLEGAVAVEDDVLHAIGPEDTVTLLSQDPADGIANVALAATVWPDDSRYSWLEENAGLSGKGLEADQSQL
jgi:hypothetical protein